MTMTLLAHRDGVSLAQIHAELDGLCSSDDPHRARLGRVLKAGFVPTLKAIEEELQHDLTVLQLMNILCSFSVTLIHSSVESLVPQASRPDVLDTLGSDIAANLAFLADGIGPGDARRS